MMHGEAVPSSLSTKNMRWARLAWAISVLTIYALVLSGCTVQSCSNVTESTPPSFPSDISNISANSLDSISETASGTIPTTPEEKEMVAVAAERLNVPSDRDIVCIIGESFYSKEASQEVRSVSFYEQGMLCAGADCAEDGTPLANLVYY